MKNYILKKRSMSKLLFLFLLTNLFALASTAQVKISGKITDAKGNGISGVSVTIKNSTAGTSTNANGNYEIVTVLKQGKQTLVFSAVGSKTVEQIVTINASTSYEANAQLGSDPLGLDEIVVTGTTSGTTKKQLGSYVSTVKGDQLTKGASSNALMALQGKTLGAQITQNNGDPAGSMSVRLRGVSSLSSSEPLYVIDGVVVNNSTTRVTNTQGNFDGQNSVGTIGQNRMVDINPNDIERIEVLNGAAAAAIYGSRANAGVIQIFTKKGKSGAPVVSFSTTVMSSSLRKKLDVNRAPNKFGPSPDLFTQDIIQANKKTIINPITGIGTVQVDTLATFLTPVSRYDYQDYIFRNAIGTDNNINVTGGTDKTKYFMSGSYYYNQGIIKNTDFQRFSFRTNIDQVLNKWLSASIGLNYVNSSANEKPDGNAFFSPMNSVNIIGNFYDIQQRDAFGNIKAVGDRGRVNPVSVIEDLKQKNTTNRLIASVGLKLKPIDHLSIDYTMGIDNYAQKGTTFMPPYAYNVTGGSFGGGGTLTPSLNGYTSSANTNFFGINHDVNATYNINITKDLNSVTQVGFSQQYENQTYLMAQGQGILVGSTQTVSSAATQLASVEGRGELSITGSFIQQNFKYKNFAFLTGALRRDASSLFSGSQRNQTYAKVSGSVIVSNMNFWQNTKLPKWIDLVKVRAAYGESGNLTSLGATDRFNLYTSSSFVGSTSYASSSQSANPNVGPERQKEFEFGTDLGFLNNRVTFTLNVYNKKVNQLNIARTTAPTTGFSTLLDNVGNLENKGYEIMLTGTPVLTKDFSWTITGLYNSNKNKITNLPQPIITYATNGGAPVALIEGQPVGVFWGTFFQTTPGGTYSKTSNGLPNHNGLVLSAAGIPRTAYGIQNTNNLNSVLNPTVVSFDSPNLNNGNQGGPAAGTAPVRKIIGNPNPKYTTTLINEFNYKNFSLRVQIDATKGNDVFNADFRTRQGVGNGKIAELEQTGQLPRGYISAYIAPSTSNPASSPQIATGIYAIEQWRIDDGSNVRLRELSLSYRFGKIGKAISDLSINFTGRNLAVWTKYIGYDPEVNAAGQSTLIRGVDFGSVPIPKTFSIGVQAKF
jgi:TonB-linked SusC/RagA family outer membrane protein